MAIRAIVNGKDPFLRKTSRPQTKFDERLFELLDDMAETMRQAGGVGLAAPQVGILRRVVVIETEPGNLIELINPEIIETRDPAEGPEGCLSFPGQWGITIRPTYAKVRALDRNGNEFEMEGNDLLAKAFCHEIDHLDGKVFVDRVIRNLDPSELEQ